MVHQDSCTSTFGQYRKYVQESCCGKTCRGHSHPSTGRLSDSSCPRWMTSGMVWHGEYWTANSGEWHNDAAVSSLSDALETQSVPQRYYLTPKACIGILNRAESSGKRLPKELETALREQIRKETTPTQSQPTSSPSSQTAAHRSMETGQDGTAPEPHIPSTPSTGKPSHTE